MTGHHEGDREGFYFTKREREIIEGLSRGLSNQAIGDELYISINTVKTHLTRIAKIMNVGERAGIVGVAYRTGLLKVEKKSV